MLKTCTFNSKVYRFYDSPPRGGGNVFTVIVGKNGAGKSRLLKRVIESFLPSDYELFLGPGERARKTHLTLRFSEEPTRIIAVSTSPFDKFPILRDEEGRLKYEYLGIRRVSYGGEFGLALMARSLRAMLKAIVYERQSARAVETVLEYLGYAGVVHARLVWEPSLKRIERAFAESDPIGELIRTYRSGFSIGKLERFQRLPNAKVRNREIVLAFRAFERKAKSARIDIVIDAEGARMAETGEDLGKEVLVLLDSGLLRLGEVVLEKSGKRLRVNDASSGEQSVVTSLLGMAGHVRDGALICIDEPETCLHPEWQERYIKLLMEVFSGFKGCHFVVATHSPQIVSRLNARNCYVMDMETGETTDARHFVDRSADFQLARIFRAPGFKNEYLSREFISVLAVLGGGQELSSERLEQVRRMLLLRPALEQDDPVRRLMDVVAEVLQEMGE